MKNHPNKPLSNQGNSASNSPQDKSLFPNKTRKDKILNGLIILLLLAIFVVPIVFFSYRLIAH